MLKPVTILALLAAAALATGCDDPYVTCDVDGKIVGDQVEISQSGLYDANGDGVIVLCVRP